MFIYLVIVFAMITAHFYSNQWTLNTVNLFQQRQYTAHHKFVALVDIKTSVHKYMKEMGDVLYTDEAEKIKERFAIEVPMEQYRKAVYSGNLIPDNNQTDPDSKEVEIINEIQAILIIMERKLARIQEYNRAGNQYESEKLFTELSKTIFKNEFINLINRAIEDKRAEAEELKQRYAQVINKAYRFTVLTSLLASLLILTSTWLFLQDLRSSFKKVSSGVKTLIEGRFDQNITESGNNEFSNLAHDLNLLAKTIRTKIGDLNLINEEHLSAKEESEASRQAMSEFLANMSHEVRTPMNGIIGLTDLLLKMDIKEEKQLLYTQMVKDSADRLFRIINDILDFSKINARRLDLEVCNFSLRETISSALAPLNEQAKAKDLTITQHLDEQIPDNLIGDPLRLTQVLINLVNNAVKFTKHGGVEIFVEEANRVGKSRILHFEVRDTGIGVPVEIREKIFKAFTQAEPSFSRNYGGSGLGLAISSELTRLMGGRVWIESNPLPNHQGSSFHFTVRLEALADEFPTPTKRFSKTMPEPSFPKEIHILLADDEPINRILVNEILTAKGWLLTEVENGEQALETMQEKHFDLVLMDIEMPYLDGCEVTRRYRAIEAGDQHLPIIAITAHAIEGFDQKCLAAGMDGYISKPFDEEELLRLIITTLKQGHGKESTLERG